MHNITEDFEVPASTALGRTPDRPPPRDNARSSPSDFRDTLRVGYRGPK